MAKSEMHKIDSLFFLVDGSVFECERTGKSECKIRQHVRFNQTALFLRFEKRLAGLTGVRRRKYWIGQIVFTIGLTMDSFLTVISCYFERSLWLVTGGTAQGLTLTNVILAIPMLDHVVTLISPLVYIEHVPVKSGNALYTFIPASSHLYYVIISVFFALLPISDMPNFTLVHPYQDANTP
uniref:CNNM transmembrane domain-containing protein n=1 Tax=Panagrellus redivivus TaxID=6233 RepID=A0A7E4VFI8_PANRE